MYITWRGGDLVGVALVATQRDRHLGPLRLCTEILSVQKFSCNEVYYTA